MGLGLKLTKNTRRTLNDLINVFLNQITTNEIYNTNQQKSENQSLDMLFPGFSLHSKQNVCQYHMPASSQVGTMQMSQQLTRFRQ